MRPLTTTDLNRRNNALRRIRDLEAKPWRSLAEMRSLANARRIAEEAGR